MMNNNQRRPSAEELAELNSYLNARQRSDQPAAETPAFPSGLTGELLQLAESTQPDPAFTARLELQLRQAARARASRPMGLTALWQSLNLPERKISMKRMLAYAVAGILLFAIARITLPSILPSPGQTQMVAGSTPTNKPLSTPATPLTPTVVPPTPQRPVAINFTPQPLPSQAPSLPKLASLLGTGYGGYGVQSGKLPLSLIATLPDSPAEVGAYYRLENTPLTLDEARQVAQQWNLQSEVYMPAWMQSITPDELERSYIAIAGMQQLSMWNGELSFTDLGIFPIYGGHQYPQTDLPNASGAADFAAQYLAERGLLNYPYRVDLSSYEYGLVKFYSVLDDLPIGSPAATVKVNPLGQVGQVWISREQYQSVGTYPVISASKAWDVLNSDQASEQVSISYYPAQDGNPQYWGRLYPVGKVAHLFGSPTIFYPADGSTSPYVQLNNLVLAGDLASLVAHVETGQGYIHAWGEVQEQDGQLRLVLQSWEPFDEFSGYFNGTVSRTAQGDFLALEDGSQLSLPDLPADVPADTPLYVQGGLVGDTLEWFILQVHPADEGQEPADLSQGRGIIDKVELVYLAPDLNSIPSGTASDPAYRMLVPAWKFTGHVENVAQELIFQAYVKATP